MRDPVPGGDDPSLPDANTPRSRDARRAKCCGKISLAVRTSPPDLSPHDRDRTHVPALDGVRGLAVGAVLMDHLWPGSGLGSLPLGMVGVKLFFVLSGYLISGILLRGAARADAGQMSRGQLLRTFYTRRFLRIVPIYYLALGVAAALDLGEVRQSLVWHLAYASNFYAARTADWPPLTGHFWSLALEAQFYLIWPWLLVLAPASRRRAVVIGVIVLTVAARAVAAAAGMGSHALGVLPIGSLDALAMGALIAALREGDARDAAWVRRIGWCSLLIAAPLFLGLTVAQHLGMAEHLRRTLWPLCLAFVFSSFVGWVAGGPTRAVQQALEWSPLRHLGEISYGAYVYHPFLAHAVLTMSGAVRIVRVETSLLCLVVSLTVAEVSWRLIEAPLLERGRRAGRTSPTLALDMAAGRSSETS